jgi:adenylosuccinate lyase
MEWIALPEIFCLSAGALAQARFLVTGLQIDPERVRKNLDATGGLVLSEAVIMGLGPVLGRQRAHDLVYDICRQVIAKPAGRSLICSPRTRKSRRTWAVKRWQACLIQRTILAFVVKWSVACWR